MSNNTITLSDAEYDFFINKAREAGRREGLESIKQKVEEQCGDHCNNWCWHIKVADIVDALIDSPKAEGEEPPKMLYVAFDCLGNPYAVSTRPEHIACDPARIKPYVPVEAEGEETK